MSLLFKNQVYRMMYEEVGSRDEFAKRFSDYVEHSEDGTYEIWGDMVRQMYDDLATGQAVTEDEYNPYIKQDDVDDFEAIIGKEKIDMLLNNQVDYIMLVNP